VAELPCVDAIFGVLHRRYEQRGGAIMKSRLTFEMEAELKTSLESWAREEDRSIGSLLRRIAERSLQERRAANEAAEAR
jgi:hypothetical protein